MLLYGAHELQLMSMFYYEHLWAICLHEHSCILVTHEHIYLLSNFNSLITHDITHEVLLMSNYAHE